MVNRLVAAGQALAVVANTCPNLRRLEQHLNGYDRSVGMLDGVCQSLADNLQGMDFLVWRQRLRRQVVFKVHRVAQSLGKLVDGLAQSCGQVWCVQYQAERGQ